MTEHNWGDKNSIKVAQWDQAVSSELTPTPVNPLPSLRHPRPDLDKEPVSEDDPHKTNVPILTYNSNQQQPFESLEGS